MSPRLLVMGSTILLLQLGLTLPALGQQTQWRGDSSTVWRDSDNWSNGVPDSARNALISTASPFAAYVPAPLAGDTASTDYLTMQSGGYLYFDTGGILIVYGNQKSTNDGVIVLGSGRIVFKQEINFLNGGTFDAGSGTLEFSGGSWTNNPGSTFDAGTSTTIFNSTGDQTFTTHGDFSFYNLEVNTQGTVTLEGSVTVDNDCYIAAGTTLLIPLGSTLTVNGTISGEGSLSGDGSYPPLPVQMISFTAVAQRLSAVLQWSTATEVNNFGFDIERRTVHTSGWTKVGFVQGHGTSSSPHNYSFVDEGLQAGRYAYRIRQTDNDGTSTYFSSAEVEVGAAAKELSLGPNYPNPFNPSTTIEFTLPENGRARLKVFNMIGQEVATLFDNEAEAGKLYQAVFSATSLPSGLYFYRLEFANQSLVKRMMLVK